MSTVTLPTPDTIREEIRARCREVRALRDLLRAAESLERINQSRSRQLAVLGNGSREEVPHAAR